MANPSWNRSLTLPSFGKAKAAATAGKAGKAGKAGRRANRPNPIFLVLLGVVMLAAVFHFVVPSLLGGGGSVAPFTPSNVELRLVPRTQAALGAGVKGSVGAAIRTARDPFAVPAGYSLTH
jgi:hypothetical protein